MISIEIYDPAMCCSTGVCGPSVDPELIRVSTVVHNLKARTSMLLVITWQVSQMHLLRTVLSISCLLNKARKFCR